MKIERNGYTVVCGEPILYVDNESRGRSGHMTHAMAEFAPRKIIDFNSNCSAAIYGGHSTFGEEYISPMPQYLSLCAAAAACLCPSSVRLSVV